MLFVSAARINCGADTGLFSLSSSFGDVDGFFISTEVLGVWSELCECCCWE